MSWELTSIHRGWRNDLAPDFELLVPTSRPIATKQFISESTSAMLRPSATIRSRNRAVVCVRKRINRSQLEKSKYANLLSHENVRCWNGPSVGPARHGSKGPVPGLSDRTHQCAQFGRIRISEGWHLVARGEPSLAVFRQTLRWRRGTSLSGEGRQPGHQ